MSMPVNINNGLPNKIIDMIPLRNLLWFLIITNMACSQQPKPIRTKPDKTTNNISYAKGFAIQYFTNYKKLSVFTAYKEDSNTLDYYLIPKTQSIPDSLKDKHIIRTPIERIVVTSTTHIPMLELLGKEHTLVGFPNTQYISSPKTRQLIESGQVQELGQAQQLNTEILIDLKPELVVGFGVNNTGKIFESIQKMGIPVIFNSDWLEKTPLGRAEWIRFFGALYNQDSLAGIRFQEIADRYNQLKKGLQKNTYKPTVLSGALFQDTWHLPAGESYVARFIADAGGDYLWKNTRGNGSLSLSFESVLDRAKDADYWIAPGYYSSKRAMLEDTEHYAEFKSFTNGSIYTFANTKGPTGGILYYEIATTRPDLVLQDFLYILHPELDKKHSMTFFKQLP